MELLQGFSFLLCKAFFDPLLLALQPSCFHTKIKGLHRAASCTITGCISSFPISLFLFEVSLSPHRVILIHCAHLCYGRILRLATTFPVSALDRYRVKPRLQVLLQSLFVHSPAHTFSVFSFSFLEPVFLQRGTHSFYFMILV